MVRRKRNLEIIRNISGKEKQITFLRSTCYVFLHRRDHWKTRRKDSTRNFERIITSWGNFISLIIENREESAKNRKILENKNDSTQNRQILRRSYPLEFEYSREWRTIENKRDRLKIMPNFAKNPSSRDSQIHPCRLTPTPPLNSTIFHRRQEVPALVPGISFITAKERKSGREEEEGSAIRNGSTSV